MQVSPLLPVQGHDALDLLDSVTLENLWLLIDGLNRETIKVDELVEELAIIMEQRTAVGDRDHTKLLLVRFLNTYAPGKR